MNAQDFLDMMRFPAEWQAWGMTPDEDYIQDMIMHLKPGMEHEYDHFRHHAFHHWLTREPTRDQLEKLVRLTFVDPDQEMARSIRAEILAQPNCDAGLRAMISADE